MAERFHLFADGQKEYLSVGGGPYQAGPLLWVTGEYLKAFKPVLDSAAKEGVTQALRDFAHAFGLEALPDKPWQPPRDSTLPRNRELFLLEARCLAWAVQALHPDWPDCGDLPGQPTWGLSDPIARNQAVTQLREELRIGAALISADRIRQVYIEFLADFGTGRRLTEEVRRLAEEEGLLGTEVPLGPEGPSFPFELLYEHSFGFPFADPSEIYPDGGKPPLPKLYHVWHSGGLLPLAWMEVFWAMEHKIQAKLCPVCGRAFALGRQTAQVTCSAECRRKWAIMRRDGPEGYRAYMRAKMREYRKRKAAKKGE